ncbi:hypothetical protein GCM10023168_26270 [Fodinibacter luteus]|uniref:Glycosyltransferase 2-like domain-containing protein n=1 Tax=Fodinibacter luteus TaxID=552064 RepID=A0ABP8KLD2_9MICO
MSAVPEHLRKVLAVVPTLGERTDTLGPALASLTAQDGVECTVVVVAPEDAVEARRIAVAHGGLVVDDPGRGLGAAVNAGIAAARDERYFAWIGDDDAMRPGGLRTLVGLLERAPDAVVAYGGCEYMNHEGHVFAISRLGRLATWVLPWGPDLIPQPASLTRLDHLRAVGPFDESLRFVMDLDMFLRLRRRGRFVSTRHPVATYRWHPDALTVANRDLSIHEAEQVKRRHLPPPLAKLAWAWDLPVRTSIRIVSRRLTAKARP